MSSFLCNRESSRPRLSQSNTQLHGCCTSATDRDLSQVGGVISLGTRLPKNTIHMDRAVLDDYDMEINLCTSELRQMTQIDVKEELRVGWVDD